MKRELCWLVARDKCTTKQSKRTLPKPFLLHQPPKSVVGINRSPRSSEQHSAVV